jgi:uncharacterized protein
MAKNILDWIALVLVIIGGLNWGLVGIGGLMGTPWNLVDMLFGSIPILANIVYILVGLAAIYIIYFALKK